MKNKGLKIVSGILIFAVCFVGITFTVMLLWNELMPQLFSLTSLTFWQTAGLLVLARLFFGSHGHGKPHFGRKKQKHMHRDFPPFSSDLREKLKGMSREERREYIRNRMNSGFVYWDEYFDAYESAQATDNERQ